MARGCSEERSVRATSGRFGLSEREWDDLTEAVANFDGWVVGSLDGVRVSPYANESGPEATRRFFGKYLALSSGSQPELAHD